MTPKIIGLSGTNGSGKDTVGALLAEKHGFLFVSVSDLLRDELRRRGVPLERIHLRALSAEWRRQDGYGVLIDKAVKLHKASDRHYSGLAIASLRNPAEADRVHKLGGSVWWVDADARVRYERIQANANARSRGGEDDKTFIQFLAEEKAEMYQSGDEATLNMSGVQAKADLTLLNEADNMAKLEEDIQRLLS